MSCELTKEILKKKTFIILISIVAWFIGPQSYLFHVTCHHPSVTVFM